MKPPSFETPDRHTPEKESVERHAEFLSRDLREMGVYAAATIQYVEAMEEKGELERANQESAGAASQADRELAFVTRFGTHVFEAAIRERDMHFSSQESRKEALASYEEFLEVLAKPELRPLLLSKMLVMDRKRDNEGYAEPFNRFMERFYGYEKVFARDENGYEKGFLSLEGQCDLVQAWNIKGDWGFTDEEFQGLKDRIPEFRRKMEKYQDWPEVAPVIVPRLPDRTVAGVVQTGDRRTFDALAGLVLATQDPEDAHFRGVGGRLKPGLTYRPGLSLEALDFGEWNSGAFPLTAAQVSVAGELALAAVSPDLLKELMRRGESEIDISGYVTDVWEENELGDGEGSYSAYLQSLIINRNPSSGNEAGYYNAVRPYRIDLDAPVTKDAP